MGRGGRSSRGAAADGRVSSADDLEESREGVQAHAARSLPEGEATPGVQGERDPRTSPTDDQQDALERSLAERSDQYLRLAADFENFKRRKAQELTERSRYASEEAARALLPVLDNLRRAVEHVPEGDPRNGLQLVVREFEAALSKVGVEPVEAVGHAFDPALHEAIAAVESEDVDRDTVIDEVQRGYRLHDRLLRPAIVRIARPAATAAPHGGVFAASDEGWTSS